MTTDWRALPDRIPRPGNGSNGHSSPAPPPDVLAEALAAARRRVHEDLQIVESFELSSGPPRPGCSIYVVVVERGGDERSSADELMATFRLTRREAEVALSLERRLASAEIARALGISENTARRHVERVLGKLGVRSRRDVGDVLRRRSGESSRV